MTKCRQKDKHLLANWVGGGHLPNQGGQSAVFMGGGGGLACQGGQVDIGGGGGLTMQGGQDTREEVSVQDRHDG